ncbi:MAG TPA: hypothetical protein VGK82_15010 [Pyrinomonadaceae bacterium]
MKSENWKLLEEYLAGDAAAEQELFARYDRELEVPPQLWTAIEEQIRPAARSSFSWWARIAAGLVLTIGSLSVFLLSQKSETIAVVQLPKQPPLIVQRPTSTNQVTGIKPRTKPIHANNVRPDNPGVLSTDVGFDLDEEETAKHIEQTENLLRSIRNVPLSDSDDEVDVSYDKALSRRLLIENVVLRHDAEMKAKFPTKTLLADLEPLLIDIANLPDRAKAEDLRAIKERVRKTEIVAALVDYQDRGAENR